MLLTNSLTSEAKIVERIVAVVNREIVLLSELEERMQALLPRLEQIPDPKMRQQKMRELQKQLLDHVIDDKLIQQEAIDLKLEVQDNELDLAVKDVMHRNNLNMEQLKDALQQEGKTLEAYKETILRPQLTRMRVLNIRVRSRVSVSEDEIKAQYQKNLRELGVETKVHARHIFINVPDNADRKITEERKQFAISLFKQIKDGKDFVEVAKAHSDDPVTKSEGGDLGYFSRGNLPSDIEDVVFEMKKGEVRGPLRASRGFHIIQLVDKKESSARSLKEVREEIHNQIFAEKMEKATLGWLKELRKRSHVDIRF